MAGCGVVPDDLEVVHVLSSSSPFARPSAWAAMRRRGAAGVAVTLELLAEAVDVVDVDVGVDERVGEAAGPQAGEAGDDLRQERVAGEVERDAEREVGRALREVAVQPVRARRRAAGDTLKQNVNSGTVGACSRRRSRGATRSRRGAGSCGSRRSVSTT